LSAIIPAKGGIKTAITGATADIVAASSTLIPSSRMWMVKYGYKTSTAAMKIDEKTQSDAHNSNAQLTRRVHEEEQFEREELLLLEIFGYPPEEELEVVVHFWVLKNDSDGRDIPYLQ
jgi:hypothetical protein